MNAAKATVLSCVKESVPSPRYGEIWDVQYKYVNRAGEEVTRRIRVAPSYCFWVWGDDGCVTFVEDGVDVLFPVPPDLKDAMQRAQQQVGKNEH